MLDADALQIHLNPAQELIMPEGDRDFKGLFANMQRILDKCPVPVIVKETGCGMAARQVKQLLKAGFTCFDVGGAGGTNFPAIEAERYGGTALLNSWGLIRPNRFWKRAGYAAAKAILQQAAAYAAAWTRQRHWRLARI